MTSWRVCRQKDEEHRIRKEEKEAAKRLKKEKERQAREREARAMPGNPYGAYSNPMNDLERRMDGVDLGRGRNASQGEYNSKRWGPYISKLAFLISSVTRQGHRISTRSRRHRPTWAPRTLGIRSRPRRGIRAPSIRHLGMAPTYTALPLRTAAYLGAPPSQPSCRAPGPLRPILWVTPVQGCTASARRHPVLVQCRSTAVTDPVPRRPSLAVSRATILQRSPVPVLRRLFPGHPLLTGSLPTNTLILSLGPLALAVARRLVGQNNRRCCLHPMVSVAPRTSRNRTHSSIP